MFLIYIYTLVDTLTSLDGLHVPYDAAPPCARGPDAGDDSYACKALFSGFSQSKTLVKRDN